MKKVLLPLVGLLAGLLPAFAQMMPDSTVQVVAYWNVGDKYLYQVENIKSNIVHGDTTVVEKSAELLEFEVVSADEEKGYRVKVTSRDSQMSDPAKAAVKEKMIERFGNDVYFFETGPYGEFLRILPVEGPDGQSDALSEEITDAILQQDTTGLDRNALLQMVRQMLQSEVLTASLAGEISPLFAYHGSRLSLKDEYTFEDAVPMPITGGMLKMNGRFWVSQQWTDAYSVVIQMYKEADPEDAKRVITSFLDGMVKSLAGKNATDIPSVEEVYKDARIEIEDFMLEEVHLDTGWPLEWHFTRRSQVEMEGKSQNQLMRRSFTMLFVDGQE